MFRLKFAVTVYSVCAPTSTGHHRETPPTGTVMFTITLAFAVGPAIVTGELALPPQLPLTVSVPLAAATALMNTRTDTVHGPADASVRGAIAYAPV